MSEKRLRIQLWSKLILSILYRRDSILRRKKKEKKKKKKKRRFRVSENIIDRKKNLIPFIFFKEKKDKNTQIKKIEKENRIKRM